MKLNGKGIQLRKILPIVALGVAGFVGVAACTTAAPASAPADSQSPPATTQAGPSPQQAGPSPQQAGPSPQQVAQDVADIAGGNGVLTPLEGGDGQASSANCDPSTVSNPPDISTPTSASCDITYSDGSIWQQTVTITFDSQGNPVTDSTNEGIELSQPTGA
jgi:hypothetical protein